MKSRWAWHLLTGIGLCIGAVTGYAQTGAVDEVVRLVLAGEMVPPRLLIKAANERSHAREAQDKVLRMLLATPFEQRQYIFPAVFESDLVPQKIRTHPEIAVWKGKMPTDIAPEMQDFAQKYLADLNPRLYMFLAPRTLPTHQPDTELSGSIHWPVMRRNMKPLPMPEGQPFTGYGSIQSYLSVSPDRQKRNQVATLTATDIKQAGIGFQTIADFLNEQPDRDKFARALSLLRTFATDPDADKINPFQSQVQRIRMMGRGAALDQAFQAAGFQNADVFAEKADTMAKAYRAYRLDIPTALLYHKIRGADKAELNDAEQIIQVQAKMHDASSADVYFIEPYLTEVYHTFQQAGYQHILDPMMIDEPTKMEYTIDQSNKE